MSDQNPYADQYGQPQQQPYPQQYNPPKKSNTPIIILICAIVGMAVLIVPCLIALLLPAVQAGRSAARRMSSSNNMKQIGLGLHNYHATYGTLPPAYTVDANGNPLHSWRTMLLPFVEEQALYESIDFNRPWDDPVNQSAFQTKVSTYSNPAADMPANYTTYLAIDDPSAVFSGSTANKFSSITDGLSNTVMIAEFHESHGVPWMTPQDADLNLYLSLSDPDQPSAHLGGGHVLMGDGAVVFITTSIVRSLLQGLGTKAGGETVESI